MVFLLTAGSTPDLGLTECAIQWLSLHITIQKLACCKGCRQACLHPLHDVSTLQSCHNPIQLYVKSASHIIFFTFSFLLSIAICQDT